MSRMRASCGLRSPDPIGLPTFPHRARVPIRCQHHRAAPAAVRVGGECGRKTVMRMAGETSEARPVSLLSAVVLPALSDI
jgi:hypothetical protein